jgi:hypothetical protein
MVYSPLQGRLAQRESAAFTRQRSLVRTQHRPLPKFLQMAKKLKLPVLVLQTLCSNRAATRQNEKTLSQNIAFDAYFTGHKSGCYHAWNYAGKTGAPPAWPDDGPNGELMEPEGDELDAAMDRDVDELERMVETYGAFLLEVLDRLERTCVSQAFSIWTGYAAFCEENMGVAAEKVGAVILEPVMSRIEDMKTRAERLGVEADLETVEEIRASLAETWRMVEARGI